MEAKKRFAEASTSGSQGKFGGIDNAQDIECSLLVTFLKTCMKLLRDRKVVEGLQQLIDNCMGKNKPLSEQPALHKVGKRNKRTGRKVRLTVQIEEYEIDKVILDLGSDVNVFPKKTWERMGRPML